jgi:DNA-binding XRE family transcriptional regulator
LQEPAVRADTSLTRAAQAFPVRAEDPEEEFNRLFCARVQVARKACGMTQADIARLLGISRSAYARYEIGTPLAHHLIEEFVAITGVDIEMLFGVEK